LSASWAHSGIRAVLAAALLVLATPALAVDTLLPIKPGQSAGTVLIPKLGFTGLGVVMVAGSGPTDRNGNQPRLTNNGLKMLAEALARRGIASARYDKRFSGKTRLRAYGEKDIRFDHFVDDAIAWATHLKKQPGVRRIAFIGHSQGGLIATLAAMRVKAGRLVLLAAPGFNIADTLKRQFTRAIPDKTMREPVIAVIDQLRRGQLASNYGGLARQFFRPSIQSFLISWMSHDPAERLKAFGGGVLIVQGTRDLQVTPDEGARLKKAKPAATLVTIKGMNHVLKAPGPGRAANAAAYNDPNLPLAAGLVDAIAKFLSAKH